VEFRGVAVQELATLADAIALVVGPESQFGKATPKAGLSRYWFRGQGNASWPLEPGAFRKGPASQYLYDEYNMLGEMRLLNSEEARRCSTTMEWLVLTQQYGLPTRLLDWTESILVALYFAALDDSVDGRLVALNPFGLNSYTSLRRSGNICMPGLPDAVVRADQSLCGSYAELQDRLRNSLTRGEFFTKYLTQIGEGRIRQALNQPVAVYPPRNNPRITSQSGMFTLHGGDTFSASHKSDYGVPVSLEEINKNGPNVLNDFSVPAEKKRQIRNDLARLGVHQAALFPEFEYQARYIRQKWSRE